MKKRNTTASTAAKPKTAPTAAKPAETAKPVEKSSAASMTIENFFEVDGEQIKVEDIVSKICAENTDAKTLQTYFNFTERKCYYVADGKADGKFVEF